MGATFKVKEPSSIDMMDWQIVRAARTPGPGAYVIPSTCVVNGGRFGNTISKTGVEMLIHEKKYIPGPGTYTCAFGPCVFPCCLYLSLYVPAALARCHSAVC